MPDPNSRVALDAFGERVMTRLDALARISDEPDRLTRLFLGPAHRDAARQTAAWMSEAGMAVRTDALGTVVGRYEGRVPDAPALLLGSHIDTVRDAGRYDGALGVVVAIEAVAALQEAGLRLPFAVEVLAFGDEEGVRFPVTLTSSRAIAGTLDPSAFAMADPDGIRLGDALAAFGSAWVDLPALRHRSALGYLEVHIEQGPVLEAEGLPIGAVSAIAGAARHEVVVTGTAGHAGTVPMHLRRDALAAAAEMILAVEAVARDTPDLVATVGTVTVPNGAVNVIAPEARFTLDMRSPVDTVRAAGLAACRARFAAVAARRGVDHRMTTRYEATAVTCAPGFVAAIEAAAARRGLAKRRLSSGAGHDGLAMAALCPIGMIFVRCAGGISHSPLESVTAEDAGMATLVLLDVLRHWSPPDAGRNLS